MKIEYRETTNDLLTRIELHSQYGAKDIDRWMLDLLRPAKGSTILDGGCGAGKQCFLFDDFLEGEARIVGGDVSAELLGRARKDNALHGNRIDFRQLDFNAPFPLEGDGFDLVAAWFAT